MDDTAQKLDDSVTDLRAQVLNAQTLSSFGVALTNMKAFTEQALGTIGEIQSIVATNGSEVSLAVSNLVQFSGELTKLGISAQAILATNGANISSATRNIDDVTVTMKQLAADLQAGRGLAGAMLQNQELATNVQAIAANLSVTTSNLNRVGLWGILFAHKPAATKTTSKK